MTCACIYIFKNDHHKAVADIVETIKLETYLDRGSNLFKLYKKLQWAAVGG